MPRVQSAARADNFNPRSPHGERPAQRTWTSAWRDFNPRSPHGERRARRKRRSWSSPISIHAPRTGSDPCTKGGGADPAHFNPRSPHGERHGACAVADTIKRFQSTLPARGATRYQAHHQAPQRLQSTLPARGATIPDGNSFRRTTFQSTLPARGATFYLQRE